VSIRKPREADSTVEYMLLEEMEGRMEGRREAITSCPFCQTPFKPMQDEADYDGIWRYIDFAFDNDMPELILRKDCDKENDCYTNITLYMKPKSYKSMRAAYASYTGKEDDKDIQLEGEGGNWSCPICGDEENMELSGLDIGDYTNIMATSYCMCCGAVTTWSLTTNRWRAEKYARKAQSTLTLI